MMVKTGAVLAAAALAGFAFVGPSEAGGNKYPDAADSRNCGDDHTVAYAGPLKLWPPNHKLVDASITATDADGDPMNGVTLEITPAVTDEVGGDGGPNHDPDVVFPSTNAAMGEDSATVPVQLRAERSGKGEGRTYTLDWVATFDDGTDPCSSMDDGQSPFTVYVPHDMSGGADWK